MKRLTYRWQKWLADLRRWGVESSSEESRYIRRELRRMRGRWTPSTLCRFSVAQLDW